MYYVRFNWSRSGLDPWSLDSESNPSRISACKAGHRFQTHRAGDVLCVVLTISRSLDCNELVKIVFNENSNCL